MSVTLLRELVNQGHEVAGLDWQPNPLVEFVAGRRTDLLNTSTQPARPNT